MKKLDKAGKKYWDRNWSGSPVPNPYDHKEESLDSHVGHELHKYFKKMIGNRKNFCILEIGCANSIWPTYFHQYFGAQVYGLDYSEVGCDKSREILKNHKIQGKIYCGDLFSPPKKLLQKFDFVVSFGVVEHFENTAECLKCCASFVKPGGVLFTLIPNMSGIVGFLQKHVDRAIYDIHVPLTKKSFYSAHSEAGLKLEKCDYFMSINLSVLASGSFSSNPFNKYLRRMLSGVSKIVWTLENHGVKIPKNQLTSPYLIATAKID